MNKGRYQAGSIAQIFANESQEFVAITGGFVTSGVNFINVLRSAFALVYPKSVKRYRQLD